MKPKLLIIFISILMLAIAGIAYTADNPLVDDDANACNEGGTLANTCNTTDADRDGDVDQQDIDWMWRCGWYLIRVEHGMLDDSVLETICMETPVVEQSDDKNEKKKKKSLCQIVLGESGESGGSGGSGGEGGEGGEGPTEPTLPTPPPSYLVFRGSPDNFVYSTLSDPGLPTCSFDLSED